MTWVKLDDKFWANPKIEAVGNEAAGAFVRMLSHCGDQLTDGAISRAAARYIATPKVIERLEEFGLIVRNGQGWTIPTFLEYNRTKDQVLAKREADRQRKATGT